jgi:hypothetical protein
MSIREAVRDALAKHPEGLSAVDLLPKVPEALTPQQIAVAVCELTKAGALLRDGQRGSYVYRLAPAGTRVRMHSLDGDEDEGDAPEPVAPPPTRAPTPPHPSAAPARGRARAKPEETGTRKRGAPRARRSSAGSLPVTVQSAHPVDGTRDATNAVDRDLQIAITEAGVLALRRGDACLYLDPAEVQRMTAFLHRTGAVA